MRDLEIFFMSCLGKYDPGYGMRLAKPTNRRAAKSGRDDKWLELFKIASQLRKIDCTFN
jgi:hypothetical protein